MKGATWGFGTETAAHAVRLLPGGHFDRFPTADPRTHGRGASGPAVADPEHVRRQPLRQEDRQAPPGHFADDIWITTSGSFPDNALINAILTVGADHIMFSVDYPYPQNAEAAGPSGRRLLWALPRLFRCTWVARGRRMSS